VKVKKGDTVLVIAGRDKGSKGRVIAAYPRLDKVLVEGVNRVKKHTRIVTQEAPIDVSNVMVVDGDGKPTKVGYRIAEDGQKIRVARRTGKDL
jgi:large subunit ribosomal protein L24